MKYFCAFALLCGAAFAQLPTPVLYPPGGTYTNSVQVGIFDTTSGVMGCYTTDGSTPAASVAGLCDNDGHTRSTSTNAQWATLASSGTIKALVTKAASTNSPVVSAAYTITALAPTNPVSFPTPTKITSATGNQTYTLPFLMKDAQGRTFLFYSACNCATSTDNGGTAWIAFKTSTNGTSWGTPNNISAGCGTDPGTGTFYDEATCSTANIVASGNTDAAGTMIVLIAQWGGTGTATPEGVIVMRCANSGVNDCTLAANWSAPAFLTTPSFAAANDFINPTSTLISIAAGTPGVTGSCFTSGCSLTTVLGENAYANHEGLIFTYDHGATWSDPVTFPLFYPYPVEENAIAWLPNSMNLLLIQRPSTTAEINGGPTNLPVATSSNLGTSWNSYTPISTAFFGGGSNLPIGPCGVAPQVNWNDIITRPSIAINPNNSALGSLLYGERLTCTGPTVYQWHIVTFNIQSVFTNSGLNFPLPQTLALDPVTTAQLHTTYSFLLALNSTQLLKVFEQGNTTTSEDIYGVILSFPAWFSVGGNISYGGNIQIQ